MRLVLLAFGCILILFSGCGNSGVGATAAQHATGNPAPPQSRLADEDTKELVTLLNSYYSLKDAMVAASAQKINDASRALQLSAGNMGKTLAGKYSKDDTVTIADELRPYVDTIITQSAAISGITDATCEKQRLQLGTLSSAMYGLIKKAGLAHVRIYHEYCPMAYNEKGAFWLSSDADIKNPYFGKKMLECGDVEDSL